MRETRSDDNARTGRLLDQADTAFDSESRRGLDDHFEDVVMEGLMTDRAVATYPPTGHGYPRR